MNSNISVESHITSTEQPLRSLISTMENQVATAPQSELTMRPQIQLPISPIGENESNQILIPSAQPSQLKSVTSSASLSSSLKSNVKPHALLEKPPEVRILKVSRADVKALCQVITEFQEQFTGY
jgi:hypothetical protein